MISLNLKIGDKVVVSGRQPAAQVIDITYEAETARTVITLSWENGSLAKNRTPYRMIWTWSSWMPKTL